VFKTALPPVFLQTYNFSATPPLLFCMKQAGSWLTLNESICHTLCQQKSTRHRFQTLPACNRIILTSLIGSIYEESVWKQWRFYFSSLASVWTDGTASINAPFNIIEPTSLRCQTPIPNYVSYNIILCHYIRLSGNFIIQNLLIAISMIIFRERLGYSHVAPRFRIHL